MMGEEPGAEERWRYGLMDFPTATWQAVEIIPFTSD
jgi:hypothetical protein